MSEKPDRFMFVDMAEPVETITTLSIGGIARTCIYSQPSAYKINDGPWVVGETRIDPGDTITIKHTSSYLGASATVKPI